MKKLLIANRGEIAVRVICAARELGIATVAVYSEADRDAMHVQLADESVCIGPPPARESYLHVPNIISAAMIKGADAIHPGYGFLAERSAFAEACEQCGIKFVGPPPAAIEMLGDKSRARRLVADAGVPLVPGSNQIIENEKDAVKTAKKIGFPVAIKASAGGGGKGIRFVRDPDQFLESLRMAQNEAEAAFGNSEVYVEKLIEQPRHIEFQILADNYGSVVHLSERDCSIQTARHQKMIEESPSTIVTPKMRAKMGEAAIRVAKAAKYRNAGTVEFLVDQKRRFYFLEVNTRIQVEHPVTELVTGVDLVQYQLRIASGERITSLKKGVEVKGHAIECRITAEDPSRGFAPSVGTIRELVLPRGDGVRVDTHLYEGYAIPPYYDSLLAKLIVLAENRDEAIKKMLRALDDFRVVGVATTIPFYKKMLANGRFRDGDVHTDFVADSFAEDWKG